MFSSGNPRSPRSRMTFSTVSAFLILSTSLLYSVETTCPPSPCAGLSPGSDYYEDSVTIGVSPRRPSARSVDIGRI